MKKLNLLLGVVLTAVLVLTACAQPTPTQAPTAPPATEAPATTEAPVPATEVPVSETTLVVWDQFYRDVESQVMETLNAEFEAAHPGVKIERVVKTLDDLKVTLKLALAEED